MMDYILLIIVMNCIYSNCDTFCYFLILRFVIVLPVWTGCWFTLLQSATKKTWITTCILILRYNR